MPSFSHIPLEAIMLYRKGLEQTNKGNQELALKHFSHAAMIAPNFSSALCEMGRCYEKLGRYPEALSKFNKVLQIDQTNVDAELSRNRILNKMGHPK